MDIRQKQKAIIDALEDVKGKDIVAFEVSQLTSEFDRVVIATGDSTRQVKSLARSVHDRMREMGERVHGMEGEQEGEWVLVDTGDIVVHVMHPAIRQYYNLEELWGHKPIADHVEPARKRTGAKKAATKTGAASPAAKAAAKAPRKSAATKVGTAARKRPAREGAAGAYAAGAVPARKTAARKSAAGTAVRKSPARKAASGAAPARKTAARKSAPRKAPTSRSGA